MANSKQTSWVIVGLGNPGTQYERTWHNIGVNFLEYCRSTAAKDWSFEKTFRFTKIEPGNSYFPNGVILAVPASFMNESGSATQDALKKFNAEANKLILVHDDSDLQLGEFRLESNRGSAGHNGVRSVIFTLGTQDFWRLRIGIRKKTQVDAPRVSAGDFVLKEIKSEDYGVVEDVFVAAGYETLKLIAKE